MSTQGKIKTLFSDKEKTEALFPRTKISAVSDENGKGLNAILDDMAYVGDITEDVVSTPVNADLLGGRPAGEYATQNYVANEIAKAQLEGDDVDLSGYATKNEMNAAINSIDYPVDSVNGKTGTIVLNADDVGAAPDSILPQQATGNLVSVIDSGDAPLLGLKLYGKTTQNGTPTPENPVELVSVGASGAINTTVCGKNLVDIFNENMSVMRDGITAASYPNIVNADGSLAINVNGTTSYGQGFTKKLFAGQTVTISYIVDSFGNGTGLRFRIFDINDYLTYKVHRENNNTSKFTYTFTPSVDSVYMFGWYVAGNKAMPCNAQIHDLQLEFGSTATEYEPYVSGGTLTASTPNGLPGIPLGATIPDVIKNSPVHMAGVWWNEEEQQYYISDTKDYARGKYVQRVRKLVYDGSEDEQWSTYNTAQDGKYRKKIVVNGKLKQSKDMFEPLLSDRYPTSKNGVQGDCYNCITSFCGGSDQITIYFYDEAVPGADITEWRNYLAEHPVTIIYPLAVPIETALSAEELAAYAALHTNKPNTTVYNDSGAHMEMEYYSPISAVPVDMGEGAKGKALVVDENGHVAPMKLTAAEIGAAPAGYGLGEINGKVCYDPNTALEIGFYHLGGSSAVNVPGYFGYGTMLVERRASCICQTIKGMDGQHNLQIITRESRDAGKTWRDWEYVNPPMALGVEYRTTERWNGKVVYTKLIDFGVMPNATTGYVYNVIPVSADVISLKGIAKNGYVNYDLSAMNGVTEFWRNQGYIAVKTTADLSAYTATFVVKYTKD